jgi:hypothetical protein
MLSLLPLIAQEDFLKGVKAENLMLDRIEAAPLEIIKEAEYDEIDFWHGPTIFDPLSPDGSMIAEDRDGAIWLVDVNTNNVRQIAKGVYEDIKWSATGEFLAFIELLSVHDETRNIDAYDNERLCVCNVENGEIMILISIKGRSIEYSWSPADDYLAFFCSPDNGVHLGLYVFDLAHVIIKLDSLPPCELNFSLSPNGQMLAYPLAEKVTASPPTWDCYSEDSEIFIINRDGTGKTQITSTPEVEQYVKWSIDGTKLLVKTNKNQYFDLVLKKKEKK